MGFRVGDTTGPSLSEAQRVQLLDQCTDLNTLTWAISTIRRHTLQAEHDPHCHSAPTQQWDTSLLYLPHMRDTPMLPSRGSHIAPTPLYWIPKYLPEQWVYTDGSDIKGQSRLGAAVVHIPTCATLYIDAGGTEETRNIMGAELVAIHTALDKFTTHKWVGVFTDSLFNIQTVRRRYSQQGPTRPRDYHHHMLLLSGIADLLEERRRRGFRTTLHKIRAHTNIRGNDLADAAAKMAVTQYDSLPESQNLTVVIGEIPPRPPH